MSGSSLPPLPPLPPEPGAARLVLTLGVAGLLSGLLLVGAYETTLPRIEKNRAEALRRAVFQVVPGSAALQKMSWREGRWQVLEGDKDGGAPSVYAAYGRDGAFQGYAIPAAGPGFQDSIALIYGYDPKRKRIVGMQVLESRETPGLGDKIFKDAHFVGEFKDLAVEPKIAVVKRGAGHAPHEVDGITGATISSKAVVNILNEANRTWLERLPPEGPPEGPK